MSNKLDTMDNKIYYMQEELNDLSCNEMIIKYNRLKFELHELTLIRNELFKNEKMYDYSSCDHIWVNNKNGKCCIKCGLNTMYSSLEFIDYDFLGLEEKVMVDFLAIADKDSLNTGIIINSDKDIEVIKSIYNELVFKYPNESDDVIIGYLNEMLIDDVLRREYYGFNRCV